MSNQNYILNRFPIRMMELDRFKYSKKWYKSLLNKYNKKELLSLDIGSGHKPFPKANILCDPYYFPNPDRSMQNIVLNQKIFVLCDGRKLPFRNNIFDYATCFYVIEHINDPQILVAEMKRVSNNGYIQCPSIVNEIIYDEKVHKWVFYKKNNKLYFLPKDRIKIIIKLGFLFNILYRSKKWRLFHAFIDEAFNMFTIRYYY